MLIKVVLCAKKFFGKVFGQKISFSSEHFIQVIENQFSPPLRGKNALVHKVGKESGILLKKEL